MNETEKILALLARRREYHAANREKLNAQARASRAANPEREMENRRRQAARSLREKKKRAKEAALLRWLESD